MAGPPAVYQIWCNEMGKLFGRFAQSAVQWQPVGQGAAVGMNLRLCNIISCCCQGLRLVPGTQTGSAVHFL